MLTSKVKLTVASVVWRRGLHNRVLAIRREEHSPWERRAALGPRQVKELTSRGVKVIVQPSNRRAYSAAEYQEAGAVIQESIDEAPLILGVKQVPIDSLIPDKTYAFFSHTIKAQVANMALLDALLAKRVRLIDYERLVDEKNFRLVAFGQYAGLAGMINILHGLGIRLLGLGHHTPFMHIAMPHNYRDTNMAKAAIGDAGEDIAKGRMPASIGPLVFVFTGTGNVSQGAQEVFRELPHEFVSIADLPRVAQHGSTKKVYGCVVDRMENNIRKNPTEGGSRQFNDAEFTAHPERYMSTFPQRVAPYASVIVNGVFWKHPMPRLISLADSKKILQKNAAQSAPGCPRLPHRLIAISDVSADPGGSIEFMQNCTTIEDPFELYDAETNTYSKDFGAPGVLVCSIDNMPTQLPLEATNFFGGKLLPFVEDMLKSDATQPLERFEAQGAVKRAVITSNGQLAPDYRYIADLRAAREKQQKVPQVKAQGSKKILVLGAGFVAGPAVEYLQRDKSYRLTIASAVMQEAQRLASRFPKSAEPMYLDITKRADELERMVKEHDLVVSMLPAPLHPPVAKLCVKHRKNMVTTSYISPAMKELDIPAIEAGITLMNEIGLDPGIDHMLAAKCLDELRQSGSKVESFVSWCGGLPAPECSDNPLRYKFSWAPRNVFANLNLGARWLENGQVQKVADGGAILEAVRLVDFMPGLSLEGIPNRDSLPYRKIYDLGEDVKTCMRGTLRYRGFMKAVKAILQAGLAIDRPLPSLQSSSSPITWKGLLEELSGGKDMPVEKLKCYLLEKAFGGDEEMLKVLVELGLLDDTAPIQKRGTPVDTLANHLAQQLAFGPKDRDLCLLRHEITSVLTNGQRETHCFTLTQYGKTATSDSPPVTAMAQCVGASAGIAARMLIEGEIPRRGVLLPITADCYKPMLERLSKEGIEAVEKIIRL